MPEIELRLKKNEPSSKNFLLSTAYVNSLQWINCIVSNIVQDFLKPFSPISNQKNDYSENIVDERLLQAVIENKSPICWNAGIPPWMVPSCLRFHTMRPDGSPSSSPSVQQQNACRERQHRPARARGSRHCLFAQISSDLLASKILSLSQACTGMGKYDTNSLPRHTELFWFETYDCSLLKEKRILGHCFLTRLYLGIGNHDKKAFLALDSLKNMAQWKQRIWLSDNIHFTFLTEKTKRTITWDCKWPQWSFNLIFHEHKQL